MTEHHEERLLAELVDASQRGRLLTLHKMKNRRKLLKYLSHAIRFDKRFRRYIPANQQTAEVILDLLVSLGAPSTAYVVSEDPEVDSKTLNLEDAVARIVGSRFASVISCIPGQLAYYEGEEKSHRLLLVKPQSSSKG